MSFDPEQFRKDFPILSRKINAKDLVYLDSAATSQKPRQVIEAITSYYENHNANVHRGIHTLSEEASEMYEGVREKVRQFINAAELEEIIFTNGATEGINLVAKSWARNNLKEGDIVLVTEMEHHSNFVPWAILEEERGIKRRFVPVNDSGMLDMSALKELLENEQVKLLAITHVSNLLGTINPIKEICSIANAHNVVTLVDGAQAVPHLKVDVQDLNCDFYVFSAHKMLGPTGTGVLYGREEFLEGMPPFMAGGDMISLVHKDKIVYNELPWKFEAGTPNVAGVIGFGAAIDYLNKINFKDMYMHELDLLRYFYKLVEKEGLRDVVALYGPDPSNEQNRSAVCSFNIKDIHPHDVSSILNEEGIAVRSGHHCAQPLIDIMKVHATNRASFYLYNTRHEVEALVDALKKVINVFKT